MPVPVITLAQMRSWEQATWSTGQTESEVIRRVGIQVGRRAMAMTRPGSRLLILAGTGHNGDDARAAQPHLTERRVDVLNVTDPAADLNKLEALLKVDPDLIIDGLFGIGINRPLSKSWVGFINTINQAQVPILSVDVPSGLNGDLGRPEGAAVQAAVTLTVGAPKLGMLQESAVNYVGRLEVADDVGLVPCNQSSELNWTLPQDFNRFPPARSPATHKGTYGHLAIMAGSLGYHGAAVLTARGAQRAQPGLITLHTFPAAYPAVASQLQAVMVSPLSEDLKLAGRCTAVLIGPGLAAPDIPDSLKKLARDLWHNSPLPIVVDASALEWLPSESAPNNNLRVITPHSGEAARLLSVSSDKVQASRLEAVRDLSKRFANCWVVLKGHQTLIGQSTGEVYVNPSGNPHLAQGGSGDVLSGFIAGLLTQPALSADPLKTLRYAVWEHGAAADRLQAIRPNWVIEDLVEELGSAP